MVTSHERRTNDCSFPHASVVNIAAGAVVVVLYAAAIAVASVVGAAAVSVGLVAT